MLAAVAVPQVERVDGDRGKVVQDGSPSTAADGWTSDVGSARRVVCRIPRGESRN